jgi:hypothetical protein
MVGYTVEAPPLHTSNSFLTASSVTATPLLTPPSVDADCQFVIADGSDHDEEITDDFSMPMLNVEQPKLAPPILKTATVKPELIPVPETETAEPDITLAGF